MISFEEAQKLIQSNVPAPQPVVETIFGALGSVLAEDVTSPISLPVFDNSAMDGFVFRAQDVYVASQEAPAFLQIKGMIKAGDAPAALNENQAYRIMTGAPIPPGGDTVLAQENAQISKNTLLIHNAQPVGKNIRYKGEEVSRGQVVVQKGTVVNAAVVGILASVGRKTAQIYQKPRVSVIATGSELEEAGAHLLPGKIYDSNTPMIRAALMQMGIFPILVKKLDDSPKKIKAVLRYALSMSDVVILMGGVSAGETDHVKPILAELGVETIFWKVKQKPGKPLYFGKTEQTLVFGLPGNPAAVFTCFYEYVFPAIRRFMGFAAPSLRAEYLPLKEKISADPEKVLFLKAKVEQNGHGPMAVALRGQASHMISSLSEATRILVVPPSVKSVEKGELALVHWLP